MRRLIIALVLVSTVATLDGCKRRKREQVDYIDEGGGQLASLVQTSNPRTAIQLLKGFHDVENGAWRWTAGKFSVMLRTPGEASKKGAVLSLKLVLPETILAKLGNITITASIGGKALEPQTYKQAGPQEYKRAIPAAMLAGDAVTIDFALDKFIPAGTMDLRELGIIAASIGLEVQ